MVIIAWVEDTLTAISMYSAAESESVVVHFDPVTVRILQIDLIDLVGTEGNFVHFPGEISVLNAHLVQVFNKIW